MKRLIDRRYIEIMVKAELSYNPYLRETIVNFNGQAPRINSQIEKYQDKRLHDWIEKLPLIFHDEMNGYGFELHFSGVPEDYERIRKAFSKMNVPENEVSFFQRNELEGPVIKKQRIKNILSWLEGNPNRRFDYAGFMDQNKEVLDAPYSFITVNGGIVSEITLAEEKVSIENIENVSELLNTDLTNTPILMFIDSSDNIENRKNLQSIICRNEINYKQLFFCIRPSLNKMQIKRIITDLGITEPNIVSGVNDDIIEEYFEIYPLTDYIISVLNIVREKVCEIQSVLDLENEKSQMINSEIHSRIDALDNQIRLLKEADDLFVQRDNLVMPQEYAESIASFSAKIAEWRKKKTKTTNKEEAQKMADEFNSQLQKFYEDFVNEVDEASIVKSEHIDALFRQWFADTNVEPDYIPTKNFHYEAKDYITPSLSEAFMNLKTEQLVDQKNTLLDFFRTGSEDEEKEKILEETFTYEAWRELASEKYLPICKCVIDDWTTTLSKYYSILAEAYHKHIIELINEKTAEKNKIAEQLSEDERLLQADNDWLTELKDMLHLAERG